jgi:hypothetical protein
VDWQRRGLGFSDGGFSRIGPKKGEVTANWAKLRNKELQRVACISGDQIKKEMGETCSTRGG